MLMEVVTRIGLGLYRVLTMLGTWRSALYQLLAGLVRAISDTLFGPGVHRSDPFLKRPRHYKATVVHGPRHGPYRNPTPDRFMSLFLLLFLAAAPASAQELTTFPVYGNWCGPGHPAYRTNPPAVDILDDACRQHDICTWTYTANGCICDIAFLQTLRRIPFRDPESAYRARAMYDAIAVMPCSGPDYATKQSLFWGRMWEDAVFHGVNPWNAVTRMSHLIGRGFDERLWRYGGW